MAFVNVGAYVDGSRPKSKKALKEAMSNNPDSVYFDGTSAFSSASYRGSNIPTHVTLSVCGPDPYNKRSWYATVTSDGKVK